MQSETIKDKPELPQTGKEAITIRPRTHGDFSEGAAFTQSVMRLAGELPGYCLMNDVEREGFHMIVHKLQRITAGDPHFKEHWVDIAGYAQLVADRCK